MNILLTCAGRRNYLVNYFKHALAGSGRVLGADLSATAPAMQEVDDAHLVPRIDAPDYVDTLLAICRDHDVGLLVPLNDLELPILASRRDDFAAIGTRAVVSSREVIDICFDKLRTRQTLLNAGIDGPRTYTTLADAEAALARGELEFPVVVKPRWGTASISIEMPRDRRELELAFELAHLRLQRTFLAQVSATDSAHCVLIQECLPGREHGLDVINDLQGRHVTTFAKHKVTMRAGETDRAVTTSDPRLIALGEQIGQMLGHVGNLDCDVFVSDDRLAVLEMNPRFGGGYPFSQVAGANIPAALIAWAEGRDPDPTWLTVRDGAGASKCDRLVTHDHRLVEGPSGAEG